MSENNNKNNKRPAGLNFEDVRAAISSYYDPASAATLLWLAGVMEQEHLSLAAAATEVGVDSTTLTRILRGIYKADHTRVVQLVEAFRRRREERRQVVAAPFVETEIARTIWAAIDYAQMYQEPISIIGESQWGKTYAAEEFVRRQRAAGNDAFLLVRMPVAPTPMRVVEMLAAALGLRLPARRRFADGLAMLMRTLTARHVIIVDEMHQLSTAPRTGRVILELLREIYDTVHCGVVYIGTELWSSITHGRLFKEWGATWVQTDRRGLEINLPPVLGYKDMQALWASYGLPEPPKDVYAVVRGIVQRYGLGRYTKRLRGGATTAARQGAAFTWELFLAVHEQLEALAGRATTPNNRIQA